MKKHYLTFIAAVACLYAAQAFRPSAADENSLQRYDFATIRWAGRENTSLIRSSGKVEKLRSLLERFPRPDGIDERAFYMNIAINAAAKEGYEVAAMTQDEIVMKRTLAR